MNWLKKRAPWWLKMGMKIVLSRLPIPYSVWKRLRLFEHGDMERAERAVDTFVEHARTAKMLLDDQKSLKADSEGHCSVVEMGPGDSLSTAVIAKCFGASRVWLVDSGFFATTDMNVYAALMDYLRDHHRAGSGAGRPATMSAMLQGCNARYLIDGVQSLAEIGSSSVDYCYSNAVLEHIPKRDFESVARELFRVLKPGGVSVHRVDLRDHLGGALNNLRFAESVWESPLFSKSGFYTNRIRHSEMLEKFEEAGFSCRTSRMERWSRLPTARSKLQAQFRRFDDHELSILGFDLVLERKS